MEPAWWKDRSFVNEVLEIAAFDEYKEIEPPVLAWFSENVEPVQITLDAVANNTPPEPYSAPKPKAFM